MEIAQLVQEYFAVLAWPAVVAFCAWLFREPIKALLSRVTRLELPGGMAADVREAKKELNDFLPQAASVLVTGDSVAEDVKAADRDSPDGHADLTATKRAALERLVRESAEAGYAVGANYGSLASTPRPVIEWDDTDRPRIHRWTSEADSAREGDFLREEASRIEAELKEYAAEMHSPVGVAMTTLVGYEQTAKSLQARLRQIDPTSPWANVDLLRGPGL